MNKSQLHHYLHQENLKHYYWDQFLEKFAPETTIVNGEKVYIFDMSLDRNNLPVEENISITQQPPSSYIPLHMHSYIELTYVYEGECITQIGGKEITLKKGNMILINKNTPHTVKETSVKDVVVNIILKKDYLSPAFLSRLSKQSIISQFLIDSLVNKRLDQQFLVLNMDDHEIISDVMERIMCEFFDWQICSSEIIDSYLIILFSEMIRHSNNVVHHSSVSNDNRDVTLIDFLQYIEDHYQSCTLTEMADHFNFHPNYLTALLKKGTGKSFKDLMQLQRLNKAALYLKNSDLPIPEIVEDVGYSSVTFFYKKFKEIFGVTPTKYRDENN